MTANIKNLEERLADLGMGVPHTDQLYMDLRDDEITDLRAALAAKSDMSPAVQMRAAYAAGRATALENALAAATAPQPVAGDERAAFEAGGSPRGYIRYTVTKGYDYVDSITQAQWEGWQARAAQSARQIATLHAVIGELTAEREGWQWVPKKPTEAMVQAACAAQGMPHMAHVIKAAIAAAPAAPTGSGE